MDEDLFYQRVMTDYPRRPTRPPSYRQDRPPQVPNGVGQEKPEVSTKSKSKNKGKGKSVANPNQSCRAGLGSSVGERDMLPAYSSSIELEGVFMKKHEIEDTTKRAEDRRWHTVYVTLTGTALNIYNCKKNRSLGRTKDGPNISPDNPPWMRKAKLEKSYSLLYADAGIAADYKK